MVQEWLNNKIVAGALAGLGAAMVVDYAAFRSWKSVQEAASYDWATAAWRWFQGAVGGAVTAAGIAGVS